jgi:hypothetical protein
MMNDDDPSRDTISPPPHFSRSAKRYMGWLARELWHSCLVGNPAPMTHQRYERMRRPRAGDIVVELSTLTRLLDAPDLDSALWDGQFVTFVEMREEWQTYDEPELNPGGYMETVPVCLNPDGTEFRWTNADLVAVPAGRDFVPLP